MINIKINKINRMASLWVIINMHKNAREDEDKELFALLTSHGFVKQQRASLN